MICRFNLSLNGKPKRSEIIILKGSEAMKKLKLNPIVLIVINILAPSLYIFINGMYLQPVIAVFCGAILLLLGYFRRFDIYLAVYGLLYGIYYACIILAVVWTAHMIYFLFFVKTIRSKTVADGE